MIAMNEKYSPELWTPPNEWSGRDSYLIGGGSSLKSFDFSLLKGLNTIGCNDAFKLGPEIVKICLFGDASWFNRQKWELEKFPNRVVTLAPDALAYRVSWLLKMVREMHGLGKGFTLGWNYSTGAAAINLALSLGSRRIFLLGYDLKRNEKGESHWHNYFRPNITPDSSFSRFLKGFHKLNEEAVVAYPDMRVYNVTDGSSALPFFERMDFGEFQRRLSTREEVAV